MAGQDLPTGRRGASAIELAAAWVRMLSMEEIAQEIASNLDFLISQ